MAVTAAPDKSVSPIVVPSQFTLRTIGGKDGPFTVGRLATHLGTFEVKDPQLEQYPEGKYNGQFIIRYIFPKAYPLGGGMRRCRRLRPGLFGEWIERSRQAEPQPA